MEKLQEVRLIKGLSQSELAKASSVSVRTIQAYEAGARNLNKSTINTLLKLANGLNCKIESLISDEEILKEFKKYNKLERTTNMKNYKEFEQEELGSSDIAELTVNTEDGKQSLHFGADGHYKAYVCYGVVNIGNHYSLKIKAKNWIEFVDDGGLTTRYTAKNIDVYRAGEFGCIVHLYD